MAGTIYPNGIDTIVTLPKVTDGASPIRASDINRIRDTAVAVETELGINPSGTFSTVKDRLDNLSSTALVEGPFDSTDRAIATWSGTDGYLLRDNPDVIIDSLGNINNSTAGLNANVVGAGATGTGENSIAIGRFASALTSDDTIAIGFATGAIGTESISIGRASVTTATNSIAIGSAANGLTSSAIAIGKGAVSSHADSIALGTDATTTAAGQVVFGDSGTPLEGMFYGAVALQEITPPSSTVGFGKIYINSTDGYAHLVDSSGNDHSLVGGGGGTAGWVDDGTTVRLETSTDQVGVGTASPAVDSKVHIVQSLSAASDELLIENTNVGPGTGFKTGPQLSLKNDLGNFIELHLGSSGSNGGLGAGLNDGGVKQASIASSGNQLKIGTTTPARLSFWTNGVKRAFFESSTGLFLPSITDTSDIGAPALGWKDIYAASLLASTASGSLTITGNTASTWSVTSGLLTISTGAGNISLLPSTGEVITPDAIAIGSVTDQDHGTLGVNSTAIGHGSRALGLRSVAVGYKANTTASNGTTAVGDEATASNTNATALGNAATASGDSSSAFGSDSTASNTSTMAIGSSAQATNTGAIALGRAAAASGSTGIAIGDAAVSQGTRNIAIGANTSTTTSQNEIAMGRSASTSGGGSVAIGNLSTALGANGTSLGNGSDSVASGTAIGSNSDASTGVSATAVGVNATATGQESVSIGANSDATFSNSIAIGRHSDALATAAIAIGNDAEVRASSTSGVAIGNTTRIITGNVDCIVIGRNATAGTGGGSSDQAIAIGLDSDADADNAIALGRLSQSLAADAVAIGDAATVNASATNSIAIGDASSVAASVTDAMAIGPSATVASTHNNSIAIGHNATTSKASQIVFGAAATPLEAEFHGNAVPNLDDTYDLGTPSLRWKDGYFGPSSLHIGTSSNEGRIKYNGNLEVTTTTGDITLAPDSSTAVLNGVLSLEEQAGTPSDDSGFGKLFVKSSDSKLYFRDGSGSETDITSGGGGGGDGYTGNTVVDTASALISDDDFTTVQLTDFCHINILIEGPFTLHGLFFCRTSVVSGTPIVGTTHTGGLSTSSTFGTLDGTTGSDGAFTLRMDTDGLFYMENRLGGDTTVHVVAKCLS